MFPKKAKCFSLIEIVGSAMCKSTIVKIALTTVVIMELPNERVIPAVSERFLYTFDIIEI